MYWLPTPFDCFPFTSPPVLSPCAITFHLDSNIHTGRLTVSVLLFALSQVVLGYMGDHDTCVIL